MASTTNHYPALTCVGDSEQILRLLDELWPDTEED